MTWVQFERNVGATVTGIDPVEYQYTMETLALVEGYSTALCAPLVTAQTLHPKRSAASTTRCDDVDDRLCTRDVHRAQRKVSSSPVQRHHPNPHILDLVNRGWNRLAALRSSTFSIIPSRAPNSVAEHDELLDLIAGGAAFSVIESAARNHRLNALHAYLDHHAQATTQDF